MDLTRLARTAAIAHAAITLIGFLAAAPHAGGGGILLYALLAPAIPLVTVGIGTRLATSRSAQATLAGVLVLAVVFQSVIAGTVYASNEPMAPVLLLLAAVWTAAMMAVLLIILALMRRFGDHPP